MGYRIIYKRDLKGRKHCAHKLINIPVFVFFVLIVVVFVLGISFSGYRRVADAALGGFADDLKTGVSVQQAVASFCQKISDYVIYAG